MNRGKILSNISILFINHIFFGLVRFDRPLRSQKRRELKLDSAKTDDGRGRKVMPWRDPIDGDRVAEALRAALKRYIRLSDAESDVCAL
jgi:hypothetical protein